MNTEFQKALELNPGAAAALHSYTLYLTALGRYEDNIIEAEKALTLDPLSLVNNNSMGNAFFYAGQHHDAITQLKKTLELDPESELALNSLGWVNLDLSDFDTAIKYFTQAKKVSRHMVRRIAPLGYAYAKSGKQEEASKCLELLKKKAGTENGFGNLRQSNSHFCQENSHLRQNIANPYPDHDYDNANDKRRINGRPFDNRSDIFLPFKKISQIFHGL